MMPCERLRATMVEAGYSRVTVDIEGTWLLVGFDTPRRVPVDVTPALCDLIAKAPRKGGNVCWDAIHDAFDAVLLPATGRHRGLYQDGSFSLRLREIARVKLAIRRRKELLVALGTCIHVGAAVECATCTKRNRLKRRQERAAKWLDVLVCKDGSDIPYIDGDEQ
jgi:hypothetical protein